MGLGLGLGLLGYLGYYLGSGWVKVRIRVSVDISGRTLKSRVQAYLGCDERVRVRFRVGVRVRVWVKFRVRVRLGSG